jgi:hypothetical protein
VAAYWLTDRNATVTLYYYTHLLLCLFLPAAFSAVTPGKDEKKKESDAYALLFGTCFNEQGFSLPGARVVVELTSEPSVKMKTKKWEMLSSPRGEFAVRLPAGRHDFKITATRQGFKPAETTVSFDADERKDVVLKLETHSRQK